MDEVGRDAGRLAGDIVVVGAGPVEEALLRRVLEDAGRPLLALAGTADLAALAPDHRDSWVLVLVAGGDEAVTTARGLLGEPVGGGPRVLALPTPVTAGAVAALLSGAGSGGTEADLPVLDVSVLDSLSDQLGGAADVQELAALYLEGLPTRERAVLAAHGAGDLVGLRAAAHTLKSSSALLGVRRLADVLARLEGAAATGREDELPGLLAGLDPLVATSREALEGWLGAPAG